MYTGMLHSVGNEPEGQLDKADSCPVQLKKVWIIAVLFVSVEFSYVPAPSTNFNSRQQTLKYDVTCTRYGP